MSGPFRNPVLIEPSSCSLPRRVFLLEFRSTFILVPADILSLWADAMQQEGFKAITSSAISSPQIGQRFRSLIWTCLDYDLVQSAVFYAERYHVMDEHDHDARHLYATALLRALQPHSALYVVSGTEQEKCSGCLEIKGKCCMALSHYRQAREALEAALEDTDYIPSRAYVDGPFCDLLICFSESMGPRTSRAFPEEAALRCRAGTMALKGNLPEKATASFRQALALNPLLWEAFEGLCALGG